MLREAEEASTGRDLTVTAPSPLELVRLGARLEPRVFRHPLAKVEQLAAGSLKQAVDRVPESWMTPTAREFAIQLMSYTSRCLREVPAVSPRTLYMAWQDRVSSRAWFPVGRLDIEPQVHRFRYIRGAKRAQEQGGFWTLAEFPDLYETYTSPQLFATFQNRVINPRRPDRERYLKHLALPTDADPYEIMAVSGGKRVTDSYEVFPKLVKAQDGSFKCRFFSARLAVCLPGCPKSTADADAWRGTLCCVGTHESANHRGGSVAVNRLSGPRMGSPLPCRGLVTGDD